MSADYRKHLQEFLEDRKLLTIATVDSEGNPWASNVYYSIDDDLNIFFVSPPDTNHSQHIERDPRVSFSVVWYDEDNLVDRKAVQGIGDCKKVTNPKEIMKFLKNHHKTYPIWKNALTYSRMKDKIISSRPYVIKPSYMKFWNDELYGAKESQEFEL